MTSRSSADLWQQLLDAGLVQGDQPARSEASSPWFVRAMLGVAGWIGALFLLGFVGAGLAFVFRDEGASLVAGALCCAAAFAVFRTAGRASELASQFALAVSLAGQVMFIYGLYQMGQFKGLPATFLVMVAVFEAALAYLLDSFVHRVWSSFASALAFAYALNALGLYGFGAATAGVAFALVWLSEDSWAARGAFWRAVGWGIACVAVQPSWLIGDVGRVFGSGAPVFIAPWIFWIKSLLIAGVLIYVVYRLLDKHGVAPSSKAGTASLAAAAIVAAATYRAPGIASSLVIVLLGFAGGNRSLSGFGILAMLSYLAYFYYSLQTTLLMKSYALAGTGVILIGMWLVTRFLFGASADERGRA